MSTKSHMLQYALDTRPRYNGYVIQVAQSLLTLTNAFSVRTHYPDVSFDAFLDNHSRAGPRRLREEVYELAEAYYPFGGYRDALQLLALSRTHVDEVLDRAPRLFPDSPPSHAFVSLANAVFARDLEQEMERIYQHRLFDGTVLEYPSHEKQIGLFPHCERFVVPVTEGESVRQMNLHGERLRLFLSDQAQDEYLIFVGPTVTDCGVHTVRARRIYSYRHSSFSAQSILERCKELLHVQSYPILHAHAVARRPDPAGGSPDGGREPFSHGPPAHPGGAYCGLVERAVDEDQPLDRDLEPPLHPGGGVEAGAELALALSQLAPIGCAECPFSLLCGEQMAVQGICVLCRRGGLALARAARPPERSSMQSLLFREVGRLYVPAEQFAPGVRCPSPGRWWDTETLLICPECRMDTGDFFL